MYSGAKRAINLPQRAVELYHTGKALGVLFGRIAEIDNLMFQGRVGEAEVKYEALKQDCVAVWEGLKHKVGNASADEVAFFMGELFGDILATKGMHKGVQHLVKVVKPKVVKGMNEVGKKTKEYIEKFKNDPAGVTTAEGSIEIGSVGKNAKNAGKVGGKKAKQQVSQGTKEVAKDVSNAKNTLPAKSKVESFGDLAKRKVRETAASAKKAQSIPGVTIEKSGKILFCEETATSIYAEELSKLGLKPEVSKTLLSHVRHSHYEDGSKFLFNLLSVGKRKSTFNYNENFIELALTALKKGTKISDKEIVFTFKGFVGRNAANEATQTILVVLTKSLDAINTVYPI